MLSKPLRLAPMLVAVLLAPFPAVAQEEEAEPKEHRQPCFTGSAEDVTAVAVTRDAQAAAAIGLEDLFVYIGGLAPIGSIHWSYRPIHMAPHPQLTQMAVAADKVRIVELATKKSVAVFKPAAWFVAWRKGGAQLLGIDWDWQVHVWDVGTRKEIAKWKLPLDKKASSRFEDYSDAAGLLALGFKDGTIRIFEDETAREVARFMAHPVSGEDYITGMAFHRDGKGLATCDFGQIKIWELPSGELKHRFSTRSTPGGLASLVRYYAKGTRIAFANAVGGGYGFDFLDAETGKPVAGARITAHDSIESWDMAFPDSDDPQLVALADGTLHWCRYSAATGQKPGILVKGSKRP